MERTLWHPAAVQAFGNEFEDNREDLAIEAEYQLTTEPLRIDVLIIKKTRDVEIKKNIGQIFRLCNIIEFKSPDDSATVAVYNKTHGYARVYAALNNIDIDDLSVTISSTRHPKALLAFLKKKNFKVWREQPGIYIVNGEVYPTQILVTSELSEKDNFWLANLRKGLTAEQLEKVLTEAADKPGTEAYIYAIANANAEKLEELYMRRKEGVIFTEKLDAFFRERYASDIAKNEAKLKAEGKVEVAQNLKKMGLDLNQIKQATGLSSAEIKRLSCRFSALPFPVTLPIKGKNVYYNVYYKTAKFTTFLLDNDAK